ncbi:Asp-tRNA(Asn)/Glu-tRNA(Gln) amidotransferase subunit GatC [Clostridium grantii]|uniref:Aspartyl/glutamyl-tRNA(Asn/Gln) amidotransferase subunit C n=1 Tax=Clostridium grantii DSM 8605 TaxID=1121316 RepID=A0A1M5Y5M9_9CLOT|nr:Asp-tRNA(Asn)/Glu-tRNA(Gln) amidotransferase subunit GatC [Clostridium grantii]SHI07118.1 aspartyl/glutamyl-tRNA(Asn/Gln) amidotransferase subunit C [Clostridium grantii DSM 8605]
MKIQTEQVQYIAKLAKLKFEEDEIEKLATEFENILTHFEAIDNVNLDDIDINKFDEVNREFRKDKMEVFEDKKKLFQNVKSMRDTSIQVPKVVE